jgi:hypothetical protein
VANNWVDDILAECSHVETPRSWIWWSLVTAISAVSANYYLRTLKGAVLYKPNLYVMLLGKSGLGKGFGVNLCKLLVQKADCTRVIAGRSSIQAIVSELSKQKSNQNGKPPITDSRGFVVNGELASAIIADLDALSILTDLYDGHYNPEWDNLLKVSGKEKLKQPYLVTLFGTSPEHFYEAIPTANIGGGYVARNLMVYEDKRFQNVDLLDNSDDDGKSIDLVNGYLVPKYSPHLIKISSSGGSIAYSDSARDVFNSWRTKWRENQTDEKTGFFNRVPDHVLKTAMCLTLARYDSDLIITEEEIILAIEKVTGLIYANKIAASGKATEPMANHSKVVLNLILGSKDQTIPRKLLLSRAYPFGLVDAAVLDKVLDSLYEMGWIERERIGIGKNIDWVIKLSGEPLIEYQRWLTTQSAETLRGMKTTGGIN